MSSPVLFFNAPRQCYRDVLVAHDELFITRYDVQEQKRCLKRPPGPYDVASMLKDLPPEYREPSMVMCQWDYDRLCQPCNLAPVKCPKVLLVADTHHGGDSLSNAIALALAEPWDLIVMEFNPQHCRWFCDMGIDPKRVAYISCFTISPVDIPPPKERTRGVTFCGNIGPHHVRRDYVLGELTRRGIKIEHHGGSREHCAKIYNESAVSLNISLNGDFNLRNFEIAAAGGFGVHDVVSGSQNSNYGNRFYTINDVERQIRHALENSGTYLDYAREIHARFWAGDAPAHKIQALHDALAGKDMGWTYEGRQASRFINGHERLKIYEQVQELVLNGRMIWDDFEELPRWN